MVHGQPGGTGLAQDITTDIFKVVFANIEKKKQPLTNTLHTFLALGHTYRYVHILEMTFSNTVRRLFI